MEKTAWLCIRCQVNGFGRDEWDWGRPRNTATRLPKAMLEFGQISKCCGLYGVVICQDFYNPHPQGFPGCPVSTSTGVGGVLTQGYEWA